MSRLLDSLETICLNQTKLVENYIDVHITENVEEIISSKTYVPVIHYGCEVKLSVKGYVERPEDLADLRHDAKRRIAEEVFGEFRLPLAKLNAALLDRDYRRAKQIADSIGVTMFDKI